ncbi:MAG: carboxymuconolactone decarboxylase family protein, partial [Chloroflexi bacterium]|nr:carboxymuconolactone decarboxylase family protein [Chloroflexota bacterium]
MFETSLIGGQGRYHYDVTVDGERFIAIVPVEDAGSHPQKPGGDILTTLEERFAKGQAMRGEMAGGDPSHYTLPGIDQLAPDLKRIINEALFGQIWARPGLDPKHRCMVTISALTAQGQLPLLRRHIERGLNLGLTPKQVVEVFVQLTFYVGVPAVEAAMRTTKDIFEE